jgi:mannose-1-phosphate guanylyltransferase
VAVVEAEFEWDDMGAWDSLPRSLGSDDDGNTVTGPTRLIDTSGCIITSDGPEICLLGLTDVVVVAHEGKVMVIPRARVQEVKRLAQSANSKLPT